MKIFKTFLFGVFVCTALGLRGQELEWAIQFKSLSGSFLNENNDVFEITTDESNNIYAAIAHSGIIDMDPGPGEDLLTLDPPGSIVIVKISPLGQIIWHKSISGVGSSRLFVSGLEYFSGKIYMCGSFTNTADFDPDSSVQSLTSSGLLDAFLLSLDSAGSFSWVKSLNSSSDVGYSELIVDGPSNRIIVSGYFNSSLDVNPGTNTQNITNFGFGDVFIQRYDLFGNYLWTVNGGGPSNDNIRAITIDHLGNIHCVGEINNSNQTSTFQFDYFSGSGPSSISAIGNGSTDILHLSINQSGDVIDFNLIGSTINDRANNVAYNEMDSSINIIGFFNSTVDFDLSSNSTTLTSISNVDGFHLKLNSTNSNFMEVNHFPGQGTLQPWALAINDVGNTFISGRINGLADLDPGPSYLSANTNGTNDRFYVSLDQNSNLNWAFTNGGPNTDWDWELEIDNNNELISVGIFSDSIDFNPGAGNSFLSSPGPNRGLFIAKYTNIDSSISYPGPPVISSLSPKSGTISEVVSIQGQNFDQGSAPSVRFGAVKTNVISYNDSVITAAVPIGATFDPISVETDSGIAYSNEKFSTTFSGADGINQNSFDLPQILSTGDQPHYVTTLDVDGDGKADLITPNQGDNNISVFRNIGTAGNPSFAARVNFTTGTQPREVAYGDLDLDGKPDLVVANLGANTISIFKNTSSPGNISFASKVDYTTGTTPVYVQIRDFDGDGKADITVSNINSNDISLYQNVAVNGIIDGNSFVSGGTVSAGPSVHRLQAEDIDRDGKIDLIAPNISSNTVFFFRNISTPGVFNSGSFSAPSSILIGTQPNGISIGDLNGDGYPEIACVATASGGLNIRENQSTIGNISFANSIAFPTISGECEVEIVDADGDGHLDVAVGFLNTGKVTFFENSGNGGTINASSFKSPVDVFGLPCVDLEFADLDGDSLPELIVPHVSSDQLSIYRRLLNPPAPPVVNSFFPESGNVNSIVTVRGENFDTNPSLNKVFFGNMEATIIGGVADSSLQVLVPVGADHEPITVGNINGSAQSSKAFNTTFDGAESIYPGAFTKVPDISVGTGNPMGMDAGDLNGDGKADLVINKLFGNEITILINTGSKGNPSFQTFNYSTNARPRGLVFADIDVDGRLDIVVANRDANNISIFPNAFTGGTWNLSSLATKVDISVGSSPHFIEVADLDNDGKPELVVTNANSNSISILKNYSVPGSLSSSSFPYQIFKNTGSSPLRVKADDIDLDGKIDLVVGNYGSNTATVFHNTSPQGVIQPEYITAAVDLVVGNLTRGIAVGDLDGDGKPDIGVNTDGSQASVIFRNQTTPGVINSSSFSSGTSFNSGVFPLDIAFSDLDGNGKLDIATCNYGNDFVRILNNVGSGSGINSNTFQLTITLPTGSNPHGLAAIDIDGDSLTDLITPNYNGNSISIFLRNPNPPPPPKIDSLSPQSGPIASIVKVHGKHFNDTAANNTVWFGSTEGTVLNATESELDVEVPLGARFLPLTVTNSNGIGYSNEPFITTYDRALGINSSSFEPRIDVPTGATTVYNAIGDLDGDGKNDIVQVPVGGSNIFVFRNTTSGANPTFATKFNLTSTAIPDDVDLVDVDQDGKLDIVIINLNAGTVNVFRNIYSGGSFGPSSFAPPANILIQGTTNYVEMRDIDFDGKPDIIATRTNQGTAIVRKNLSTQGIISFGDAFALNTGGSFCLGQTITDLNSDGKPDIIVTNNGSPFLSVFENNVTFNNPRASSFNLFNFGIGATGSHGVASGDLDGDGDPDIGVVVGASVRIFKNNSISGQALNGSSLAPYITLPLNASSTRLEFTDMDGDGKLDIVAANHVGGNSVSVIKNNSTPSSMTPGDFETPIILSTGPSSAPHFVSVADINNDSLPDIITSNNSNNFMSIFLRKLNPCQDPTLPLFNTSADSICAGDSTWISVDGGNLNDANAWYWYSGSCGGTIVGTGDSILVSPSSNTTYYVRGEGGCTTPGACVTRNVVLGNTGGSVSASVSDTLVCLGDPLTFTASGGANYQWSGGITNGQTFTTTSPGILLSYVTGEDAFGCTSEDSVYSFVSESYSLADKGKFIGSGFESYVPLYFYCDAAETDSSLYNFNSHWISFTDIFSFIFAPFGSGCPSTTSINQSSDSYEGLNALRMDADTNGFAEASISGILAGRPNKLQGYFKTNAGPNDTIAVLVGAVETGLVANNQDSSNYVGYGEFVSTGSTGSYTQFEVPINYSGSAAADSFEISLVFVNSATSGGVKSLWFDAFNFIYDTTEVSICQGDSSFLGGAWQTSAGLYTDNLTTQFGCDSVVLTELEVLPAAIVNAGTDQTFCADVNTISLNGSFSNASSATWSGGLGTFSPNANDPNAVYSPTAAELSSGSLQLILTTAGAGSCALRSDTVTFTFDPVAIVEAGPNQNLCADITSLNLAGSITNAGGGIWTNGSGTFSPSNTALNATYSPTTTEKNNGLITLVLTSTANGACSSSFDTVLISFDAVPIANAGADQTFCEDVGSISLNGSFSNAAGINWTGGNGTFSPNAQTENAGYTPSAAELSSGSVTLSIATTGNGACAAASDNVTFSFDPLPVVNAGADQSICANITSVSLSAAITGASGGQWTSGGTGSFSPSNTDLNASYNPSAGDISNGFVDLILTSTGNGSCSADADTMRITIDPLPTANAGSDQTFCADVTPIILNGSSSNSTGLSWTGGAGTFSPNAQTANASYTPSAGELNSGSITLTLTTTGNGACSSASDAVTFTFDPVPTVNAGADVSICEDQTSVSLNGSFSGSTGVSWSSTGTGSFSPSNTDPLASYSPSTADIIAGSVDLVLTSTGNGNCSAVSDTLVISFDPLPSANAGADQSVCSNNATVNLSGAVTNASGGIWSGGAGAFAPSNTDLTATYTPSAAEIANGSVTLILTSTGNGNCNSAIDTVQITITPGPLVNAGLDQSVCADNPAVTLNGSISVATGGIWTGGSGTFTPSNSDLNATYTPSAAEITAGSVSLVLTSTGNGNCNSESDTMLITIAPAPIVDAGADISVCDDNAIVSLSGTVTNATGGMWSGGNGTFSPSANDLNASYTPIAAEITAGSVSLVLTSTGNGLCNAVSDTINILINAAPSIDLGADTILCSDLNETITLDAGSSFVSYLWSDGSSNQTLLVDNAFFQANGSTIWAEVTDNNTCRGGDTVDVSFTICVGLTGKGQNLIRNIYPNPTTGRVIIEMEETYKTRISILDQKGSTLRSFEMNGNQMELDLGDLPSAKYFIQIQAEGIDLLKGIIKN